MKEVKMFKSIDGKIFETAEECIRHDKTVEVVAEVNSAIETLRDFCAEQEDCTTCVFKYGRKCRLDPLFEKGYI